MTGCEDRQRGKGGAALVEFDEGELDQRVAGEVRALAEELPGLRRLSLGRQTPDRVVDVSEETVGIHRSPPIR